VERICTVCFLFAYNVSAVFTRLTLCCIGDYLHANRAYVSRANPVNERWDEGQCTWCACQGSVVGVSERE
jgi:hypothetical protein